MKHQAFYVYILTNKWNSVLYVGVTNNLVRRVWEHKNKFVDSFTSRYKLDKLVYFEVFEDSYNAISREKQLKGGSRKQKVELIKKDNPEYKDLYDQITQ